jgi:shikimate kinase
MGSGKTTIGKLLADALSIPFYDTDQEIENFTQLNIATLFNQSGETHFRELERSTLEKLIDEHETAVIATGGGLPCHEENIETLKRNGHVVYLKCDASLLFNRIHADLQVRPLKKRNEQELAIHLAARENFYSQAHIIIDGSGKAEEIVQRILEIIRKPNV